MRNKNIWLLKKLYMQLFLDGESSWFSNAPVQTTLTKFLKKRILIDTYAMSFVYYEIYIFIIYLSFIW